MLLEQFHSCNILNFKNRQKGEFLIANDAEHNSFTFPSRLRKNSRLLVKVRNRDETICRAALLELLP